MGQRMAWLMPNDATADHGEAGWVSYQARAVGVENQGQAARGAEGLAKEEAENELAHSGGV